MRRIELDFPVNFAPVSPDIPLLSNLTIENNIALITRYHCNVKSTQVMPVIEKLMEETGIIHLKGQRLFGMNKNHIFIAKFLRACMVKDAVIVIDRPFEMLSGEKSFDIVTETLASIENMYNSCKVLDYEWHKNFYGNAV